MHALTVVEEPQEGIPPEEVNNREFMARVILDQLKCIDWCVFYSFRSWWSTAWLATLLATRWKDHAQVISLVLHFQLYEKLLDGVRMLLEELFEQGTVQGLQVDGGPPEYQIRVRTWIMWKYSSWISLFRSGWACSRSRGLWWWWQGRSCPLPDLLRAKK